MKTKMRTKANFSLLALALLFLIACLCVYYYSGQWWPHLLLYIAEAGLVGALADLFAITALFRHPLGLKMLPHTAIIPNNRDKLVDGVVKMVEEQLLSQSLLKEKVKEVHLVRLGFSYLENKGGASFLRDFVWNLAADQARRSGSGKWSERLERLLRSGLKQINLAPYAGKALKWLLTHNEYQTLMNRMVDFAAGKLTGPGVKQQIKELLVQEKEQLLSSGGSFSRWMKKQLVQLAESSNAFNLEDAADKLYEALLLFVNDLKNPEHELRVLADEMLLKLAGDLDNRAEMKEVVENWKIELLSKVSLLPSVQAVVGTIIAQFTAETDGGKAAAEMKGINPAAADPAGGAEQILVDLTAANVPFVRTFMDHLVQRFWEWLKQDEEIQNFLERYVQNFALNLIETEHAVIGQIVRNTLNGFTEERLVEFIEDKVDTDLQRIRLNGALVGAALGAVFYGLLHGIYEPLLRILGV